MEHDTLNSPQKITKKSPKQRGVLFTLRLERSLAKKVKAAAKAEGRSCSNFGAFLLAQGFSNQPANKP